MIAIHHRKSGFSVKWIEYCEKNSIDYKLVNCFDSDILRQLEDCKGLMWHWPHWNYRAQLFARQLTYSLEGAGKKVFPDSRTCWHYDDKLGQKYLLEAKNLPLVPSYVFYQKKEALDWIEKTTFPKVFKTRNGAGSQNVKLLESKGEARKIVRRCFGKGIPGYDKYGRVKESFWKLRRDKTLKSVGRAAKDLLKLPLPARFHKEHSIEKNYAYFQDFIPGNDFDIRVIVIGNHAFAIKRLVREGGFRASGSGKILYEKKYFPEELIQKSFQINEKLKNQVLALDFVYDGQKKEFLIVEISYAFSREGYLDCPGYWDANLSWHEANFSPEYFMMEKFIKNINDLS